MVNPGLPFFSALCACFSMFRMHSLVTLDIARYKEKIPKIFFEHSVDQAEWDFLIFVREEIKEKNRGYQERERKFFLTFKKM